jgi:hypothetical protein
VGRTGTFIAIDIALEQVKKERIVDIPGIINRLRQQKMKMVQTLDQYVFIHDAVLESVTCGETEIPADKYELIVRRLKEIDPTSNTTGLETQFHLLHQVTPNPSDVYCSTAKCNSSKNRSDKFLPRKNY